MAPKPTEAAAAAVPRSGGLDGWKGVLWGVGDPGACIPGGSNSRLSESRASGHAVWGQYSWSPAEVVRAGRPRRTAQARRGGRLEFRPTSGPRSSDFDGVASCGEARMDQNRFPEKPGREHRNHGPKKAGDRRKQFPSRPGAPILVRTPSPVIPIRSVVKRLSKQPMPQTCSPSWAPPRERASKDIS